MTAPVRLCRLARFSLTSANAAALAGFYVRAFGFRHKAETRLTGPTFHQLMGLESDATCTILELGEETIELVEFDVPGAAYPADAISSDIIFQHFALVTADITDTWLGLLRSDGWRPITRGSPQRLPSSAGGVTAFKFRDPEGHPLELLSFPHDSTPQKWRRTDGRRRCLGIDHSAISVRDTRTSTAFYAASGLDQAGHSNNEGPEQNQLDGLTMAKVAVTSLTPQQAVPHVELLCYRDLAQASALRLNSNDVAATRLVFESDQVSVPCRQGDPDGHQLIILPSHAESAA